MEVNVVDVFRMYQRFKFNGDEEKRNEVIDTLLRKGCTSEIMYIILKYFDIKENSLDLLARDYPEV